MVNENKTVITLLCERAADVNDLIDANGKVTSVDGLHVVKLPCSGMIQASMIDTALKSGAAGVIVCGCQIGDCYYREGNKMIRERLLGDRPPGLKKAVDRRRIMALWLSRVQKERFLTEAKQFMQYVYGLAPLEPAKAATPAPAAAKPAVAAAPKVEAVKADATAADAAKVDAKSDAVVIDTAKTDAAKVETPKVETKVEPAKEETKSTDGEAKS